MSGVENHIKSLNEKHADLEAKIAAENNRPLPDSLVLKGLRLSKGFLQRSTLIIPQGCYGAIVKEDCGDHPGHFSHKTSVPHRHK